MGAKSALGGTQEEVAVRLGGSRRTYTRWMNGGATPTFEQWRELARLVRGKDASLAERVDRYVEAEAASLGLAPPPRLGVATTNVTASASASTPPPRATKPDAAAEPGDSAPSVASLVESTPATASHEGEIEATRRANAIDGVVCAAADAMNLPPSAVRRGLHAAFARARQVGVGWQEIEEALARQDA